MVSRKLEALPGENRKEIQNLDKPQEFAVLYD